MRRETFVPKAARLCIVLATLLWGSSFVVMKNAIETVPIYFLLAFRFLGAALVLGCALLPRWRSINRSYLWHGGAMGVCLFLAYVTQTVGLRDTSPSANAFLTTIYCVIVPFLYWIVSGKRPDWFNGLAAVLSVAGVGLISWDGMSALVFGRGTLWTLLSGFFFAAHIVVLAKSAKGRDVFLLTAIQFAVAGGLAAVCSVITAEPMPGLLFGHTLFGLLYLTVFCTVATLTLQALGQKYTEPSAASVLLSLESVFAVVFSMLFYGDRPSIPRFLGFGMIFCAVLCSETKFSFFRKKPAVQSCSVAPAQLSNGTAQGINAPEDT